MADNRSCCNTADVVSGGIREAVCIDTNRVYDSCADKDCLADMRVYFTDRAQCIIDNATSVRCRSCKIINCFIDVEAVPFNRGYYSVDITFFFKVYLDAYTTPMNPPCTVEGLTSFSKKCILFGSEGNVRIFSSEYSSDEADEQFLPTSTNPRAKVQCVDPICLDAKLCARAIAASARAAALHRSASAGRSTATSALPLQKRRCASRLACLPSCSLSAMSKC